MAQKIGLLLVDEGDFSQRACTKHTKQTVPKASWQNFRCTHTIFLSNITTPGASWGHCLPLSIHLSTHTRLSDPHLFPLKTLDLDGPSVFELLLSYIVH